MSTNGARPHTATRVAVAEISGADSIAAAIAYCRDHPGLERVVPSYVHTGTEYGDFSGIESNVLFLAGALEERCDVHVEDLVVAQDGRLWNALNGRYASVLAARLGAFTPCVGCHLYLHLMRIPLARSLGAPVISGEREHHGTRTKPNQLASALDAYVRVLASAGVDLELPIRHVDESSEIEALLGPSWPGGSPQLACVLAGNYQGLGGVGSIETLPDAFLERFLVPAGIRLAHALVTGEGDPEAIVGEVVVSMLEGGAEGGACA